MVRNLITVVSLLALSFSMGAYACDKHKKEAEEADKQEQAQGKASMLRLASAETQLLADASTAANAANTNPAAAPKEAASQANASDPSLQPTPSAQQAAAAEPGQAASGTQVAPAPNQDAAAEPSQVAPAANADKHAAATQAGEAGSSELNVVEFVLANEVVGREPKVVEAFAKENDKAFAFARINVKEASKVTFVWYRNGHEHSRMTMPVQQAKAWRTYSSVRLKPGDWKVELVANDKVIAQKSFKQE